MVIELRLIRHAQALGQHGNFARAAGALNLTQPTLTRSIAALESLLGVPLFDRTPKGVTPTAFGRVLLERGDTVLRREADLRREIGLLAGLEQGSLAIGAGPYMGETSVARAIARVVSMHPNLRIRCESADPAEVLRDVLAELLRDAGKDEWARQEFEHLLGFEPAGVLVEVVNDDGTMKRGQQLRDAGADAARGAADQRGLAGKIKQRFGHKLHSACSAVAAACYARKPSTRPCGV